MEVHWHPAGRNRAVLSLHLGGSLILRQPDLVLFTHVALLPLARMVRALAPRARVAVLGHGTEVWQPLAPRVARLLPQVDAFVSPSEFTARKLVAVHGISQDRVSIHPHALDPDWAAECDAAGRQHSSRCPGQILLSVTRLSRADTAGKGVELVLQALPAVLERFPDASYVVAGGGGDLPRLQKAVHRLGLDRSVQLLGACDRDALLRAYAAAHIFVLPTQVEGFGVVFLEAMLNRLPVVAVRASATPEVVEDGNTGLLVPAGDSAALAQALGALLAEPERCCALGCAGRSRVERLYTFEQFVARWERWLTAQVPEAIYAARQGEFFALIPQSGPVIGAV